MSKSGEILRIGHGNYSFLCTHCGFNFQDINEILTHIEYHFDILDSKAINADETNFFDDTAGISEDLAVYSSLGECKSSTDEILNCESIRTEFKIEDSSREAKTYVNELPLDIKLLDKVKSVDIIREKASVKTSRTVTKKLTEKVNVNNRSCSICESNFNSSTECKNHLRDVHQISKKVFQCYICGYLCKSVYALKRHFGIHSKINCYQCESEPVIRNEGDPRPHKCCLCSLWFENHVHFRKHFKDAHQKVVEKFFANKSNCSEYTCYICKKDFTQKYYLKNHMIVHNELKAFVCDVCGKCYRTKAVLNRHMNVHEGKIYTCDQCGKQFPYYARLRIHLYLHRTELNYKCTVCSKAFKVQKYLARHMKVHQEEKAYACKYCGKRFTFSTSRRAHEISQHNAI